MSKKEKITTGQEFKNALELIFKYKVNMGKKNMLIPVTRQQIKDKMPEAEARRLFEELGMSYEEIEEEIAIIYHQIDSDLSLHLFYDTQKRKREALAAGK